MDSDGKLLKIPTDGNVIAVFRAVPLSALIFWIVMPALPFPSGVGLDSSQVFGLLNWYDFQFASARVYVLGRRSTPRFSTPVPFGNVVETDWDENIMLPPVNNDEAPVMQAEVGEGMKEC